MLPTLLALALVLALGSVLTPSLAAQEATPSATDVAAVREAFVQTIQANDPDAFAALFAPEGVLVTPFGVFRGREEIRGFQAGIIEGNPDLAVTFTEPTVAHTTAVSRDEVSGKAFREAGAERIVIIHTLVVADGQIVALANIPDPNDPETREFFAAMAAAAAPPAMATPAS
jgi:uncharacterized protein (TIGR02246 family)